MLAAYFTQSILFFETKPYSSGRVTSGSGRQLILYNFWHDKTGEKFGLLIVVTCCFDYWAGAVAVENFKSKREM